jgi:toxin ParE1/3/4
MFEITKQAELDMARIVDWIAEDSQVQADRLLDRIWREFDVIVRGPRMYQLRTDVNENARIAVVGRYLILFRVRSDVVRIERVVHGGRDLANFDRDWIA